MSAATRRPYLTESVHVSEENRMREMRCLAATVSELGAGDSVELWVLRKPAPGYTWMQYDAGHRHGTWHYAH
jgi:hypothetical protein